MDKIDARDVIKIYELENKYEEMLGVESSSDLYPRWWYDIDYAARIRIINEAISQKSMIRNLEEVQDMEYRLNVNKLFDRYQKNLNKNSNSK